MHDLPPPPESRAPDFDSDDQDGALFRFWIRGASDYPYEVAKALAKATTPAEYRRSLIALAAEKRVNLPLLREEKEPQK